MKKSKNTLTSNYFQINKSTHVIFDTQNKAAQDDDRFISSTLSFFVQLCELFFLLPHKILTKFFQVELTASMESLERRHGLIAAASSALMKAYDQMPNFD
jgi:hypothetical protein